MGHDFGDFTDEFRGRLHLEYTGGHLVVWNDIESDQILRLSPHDAELLRDKITECLEMYHQTDVAA